MSDLRDYITKLRENVGGCISLSQLLIILEHYVASFEEMGLKQSEIEEVLRSVDTIHKQITKLSNCRVDLVSRALRIDPRIKRLGNYMHVIMEILQRECGQQTSTPSTPPPTQRVVQPMIRPSSQFFAGKYEVIRVIGEGGMGVVWLARDVSNNGLVAIKTPKLTGNPVKDELNIKKVIVEAEILQNLDHPHIVKMIDYFVEGQKPHLVMEYVWGDHLEKKVKPIEHFSEREIIDFMKNLADAVDYMHGKNIVHRDLKPKNIFIQGDKLSNIKVIDFGTAKYYHSQIEYGEGIFSPGGYTAPEQLKFMYSPQSDIWSLGGILFYVLTGVHPVAILRGYPNVTEPPAVEKIKSLRDLNNNFIKAIRTALDPDPVKRYLKASDLVRELQGESLTEKTAKPKIIVLGKEIEVEVDRVIIGRITPAVASTVTSRQEDKVITIIEGNNLYIYIDDPKSYISRLHVEITRKGNEWYVRDLGSLNKTAILEGGEWKIVHSSYKTPSRPVRLGSKSIISLGYDDKLGPYLVVSFLSGSQ